MNLFAVKITSAIFLVMLLAQSSRAMPVIGQSNQDQQHLQQKRTDNAESTFPFGSSLLKNLLSRKGMTHLFNFFGTS